MASMVMLRRRGKKRLALEVPPRDNNAYLLRALEYLLKTSFKTIRVVESFSLHEKLNSPDDELIIINNAHEALLDMKANINAKHIIAVTSRLNHDEQQYLMH